MDGGAAASRAADGNELVVTPAAGIVAGRAFTVVVDYGGVPEPLGDQDARRRRLAAHRRRRRFALGQPESASTWFPVNDHPSDKATFALAMTVPDGLEALSNGVPGPADDQRRLDHLALGREQRRWPATWPRW